LCINSLQLQRTSLDFRAIAIVTPFFCWQPTLASDSSSAATRDLRGQCYVARDAFYQCAAAAVASSSAAASSPAAAPAESTALPCASARKEYEATCPRAWVKYWDERVKRGKPLRNPGEA